MKKNHIANFNRFSKLSYKTHQVKLASLQNLTGGVLRCFSVLDNGRDLLSTKTPRGAIKVIDGIRVISTLWVLLGHSFDFAINRIGELFFNNILLELNQIKQIFMSKFLKFYFIVQFLVFFVSLILL